MQVHTFKTYTIDEHHKEDREPVVQDLNTGDRLPNTAIVIETGKSVSGDNVVLAKFNGKYVTWCYSETDHGCYLGSYFDNLIEATGDFSARLAS